jgi:hypothetical protein
LGASTTPSSEMNSPAMIFRMSISSDLLVRSCVPSPCHRQL